MDLDDIVLVHYPNPDVKFLGVLKFDEEEKAFYLQYQNDGWQSMCFAHHGKYQRIGKSSEKAHLLNMLGRYDKKRKTDYLKKILIQKI